MSTGTSDVQTISDVTIDPTSTGATEFDMTSTLYLLDGGGADDDGFSMSINLNGSQLVEDRIDVALVIDTSGSAKNDSGTDFDGDGSEDSILEAELTAALEVFDSYIDAGYEGDDVVLSLVSFAKDSDGHGYYTLDERDEFVAKLEEIQTAGAKGTTDFDDALNEVSAAFADAGADPDGTNLVIFMSDGKPNESSDSDIVQAAGNLEDEYNAVIHGIGIGSGSSLAKLDLLDNTTSGAVYADTGDDLTDLIVQPLTEADFLRFEIEIEGVDSNGDPMIQSITLEEGDPSVILTSTGWSVQNLDIDPEFVAPQDLTVTVTGVFAEDPSDAGSGEQELQTVHNIPLVICFTPGVMILTPGGVVPVETLRVGDAVVTCDHGVQAIRWVGSTHVPRSQLLQKPQLYPILIRQDALGPGRPNRDMRVSRQHRILIDDWRAALWFGEPDGILVPAVALINGDTIVEDTAPDGVTYIHLAFDTHEVIFADGIEAESFHPSRRMIAGMSPSQRAELLEIFPDLQSDGSDHAFDAARPNAKTSEARVLAMTPLSDPGRLPVDTAYWSDTSSTGNAHHSR